MGSFTPDFFKNNKTTSSSNSSSTKKKKNKIDVNNFTESFFSNYNDEDLKVSNKSNETSYQSEYLKTQEQVDEYNDFISKLNTDREEYYKKQQEREIKRQQEEAKKQQEEFNKNKDSMKQERTNHLIYNWDYDSSNNATYDYKGVVDKNSLSKSDKLGITTIDKTQYSGLVNNEIAGYKKQAEEYDKKQEMLKQFSNAPKLQDNNYVNKHSKEGWIIKDGEYYKPNNGIIDDKENSTIINGKSYIKVTDEKPKTYLDETSGPKNPYENKKSIYESQFDKLNKAIENGDYTTANNALQVINEKYFGHSYNDGIIANGIFSYGDYAAGWFQNKFNSNVERLNVINDTLNNNTTSEEVKVTLTEEKNKLELENQLIQYNRLFYINSLNKKVDDVDAFIDPVHDAWKKVGTLWGETFDEFDDGYQLGDVFKTGVNIFNNSIQSLGATGKMINGSISSIESLKFSDLDDSEFKDTWLPAITDVATYLIPYVGQARFVINYAEPASVISSALTREGSATIDTSDGSIKTANGWNALGATINIAANYFSDYIFSRMRGQATGKVGKTAMLEAERKWYSNSARRILTNMGFSATGEAAEEFAQTYAEAMQNINEDMSWNFFKEHYAEAIKAAEIAFVTSAGASAVSSTFNTIKYGDQASYYNAQGDYIGPGAEEGLTSFKKYVEKYGVYGDEGNLIGVQNIRINEEVSDESGKIAYTVSDTKEQEKYNYSSLDNSNIKVDVKEDAITNIETQLEEGKIVTLTNTSVVDDDIDVIKSTSEITVGDANITDNTKTILVPSDEMATYIKSLNPNQKVYVFDPKSESFYDDIVDYINNSADSNIIFKNANDFTPSDYTFSPIEVKEINNLVDEYRNKGNLLETLPTGKPLATITPSDITSGNINDIMNTAKSKFLGDVLEGKYSKEIAQKEFKTFSEKLEQYATKTKENRTYIKDSRNNIVTFFKTGDNIYEAVNTVTGSQLETNVLANVKTDGNIINGNLNSKLGLMKKQINAVNKLHDAMKLKGNYLTENSTGKEVASLVNQNRNMSKEILQALGVDGIIQGKNKVILTTAYSGMDNANMPKAIDKSVNYVEKQITSGEMKKKAETTAPKQVEVKAKPSEISTTENQDIDKALNSKYKSITTGDEINDNIALSNEIDKVFEQMKISDKSNKVNYDDLKTKVKKWFFDRYIHINEIAKPNNDTYVREAITQLEEVASDAQIMIHNVQLDSSRDINNAKKSLDQIFNQLKTKKQKKDYDKYHRLQLHIERLNAGVEGVVDLSKSDAQKLVDKILKTHPEYNAIDNDLRTYNNTLLDLLEDNGVISHQLNEKLRNRYKYYMPIYSSELTTFKDLGNAKYLKNMKVDNTIDDVTKASKNVKSLRKSMEDKTYNVLSAIAKNNLATTMSESGNYTGDSSADLIYYKDGQITKMKTTTGIVDDITNNSLLHIADEIANIPVLKQFKQLSDLSYKFVLDSIYQVKNLVYDCVDSSMIYSKDKAGFIKNYPLAAHAISANSEILNEARMLGLMDYGKINIEYDANGNTIEVKENKYSRLYNNLENIPKLAEYMSLKEKYMKQARADYEAGKYTDKKFINSKVKNENGNLIKVYHGSEETFEKPNIEYSGKNTVVDDGIKRLSFTDNKKVANTYTYSNEGKKSPNANIVEGFLNIERPLIIDAKANDFENIPNDLKITESNDSNIINDVINSDRIGTYAKQNGYDGVIINNVYDVGNDVDMYYLAFDPEKQEKAAKEKLGTTYIIFDNNQFITTEEYNELSKANTKNNITVYRTNLVGGKKIDTPSMFGDGKYYGLDTKTQDMYEKEYTYEGAKVNKTSEIIDGSKLFDIEIEKNYSDVGADYYYDTKVAQILGNSIINNNIATKEDVDSILNNENITRVEKMNKLNKLVEAKGYSGLLIKFDGTIEPNANFSNNPEENKKRFNDQVFSIYGGNQVLIFDGQDVTPKTQDNIKSFADIEEEIKMRAKLDAQDVNLHFDSGGTISKALSKLGVRFFNAGTLGLDKFVTHVGNGVKTPKGAGSLMFEFVAVGVGTALANRLINGDDEDYDKLPYYYKNNYFMIKLDDGQYLRVPKGRVQALYNVLFEYASGIRTEDDAKTYAESLYSAFDQAVLPPDLGNANPFAGFSQAFKNEDAFGNEIYSNTYDSNTKKVIKSGEHILSSYFGRYGRIANDIIDGATGEGSYSDILGEFDFYKDTTKANRHLSTVYNIRDDYQYKKELKTTNDKAEKKYIDTGISAVNSISAEINDGKERGLSAQDMKELYAARDDLINQIIHNYKNYDVVEDDDGTIWYYFDDHCFKYYKVNHQDGSSDYQFKKMW